MVVRGRIKNGVVVLDDGVLLPEGEHVTVVAPDTAGERKYDVTDERREAALSLIGILKTDQPPPSDEEVERIIDEARMKKYG
jgi:hypothetical protein